MEPIDCACVIHSDKYDWMYVERLKNMLQRNFSRPIRLHVWTEANRIIPNDMIHHPLDEWAGVAGPRKSWWYKMQMFDPKHNVTGQMLYFDLDVVIVNNLDWMLDLDQRYFWTVRDFRYLWRSEKYNINSSIMIWNACDFDWIWKEFNARGIQRVSQRYPGDQDYLNRAIPGDQIGFLPEDRVRSWRWQVLDGGYDHRTKSYRVPGLGSTITDRDCVVVFHGDPKPSQVTDTQIVQHWC